MNGIFNLRVAIEEDDAIENMKCILRKTFACCKKGIIFNFISTYVNWRDEDMSYFDPFAVGRFCVENLSAKVHIEHHYNKCDVCIMVEK